MTALENAATNDECTRDARDLGRLCTDDFEVAVKNHEGFGRTMPFFIQSHEAS